MLVMCKQNIVKPSWSSCWKNQIITANAATKFSHVADYLAVYYNCVFSIWALCPFCLPSAVSVDCNLSGDFPLDCYCIMRFLFSKGCKSPHGKPYESLNTVTNKSFGKAGDSHWSLSDQVLAHQLSLPRPVYTCTCRHFSSFDTLNLFSVKMMQDLESFWVVMVLGFIVTWHNAIFSFLVCGFVTPDIHLINHGLHVLLYSPISSEWSRSVSGLGVWDPSQ